MKRGRLPLTALRSFESAGRHRSFSRAAEELFVSQAAVSRQVRELEALIGRPLFERLHRRVELTETGTALLDQLTDSFDAIDRRLTEITANPTPSTVKISVEPSFGRAWLVPKLSALRRIRADFDVAVDVDGRLAEFRGHEPDLAVRYSMTRKEWPRVQAVHLADVSVAPVLSPSLLASGPPLKTAADLVHHTLLHEDTRKGWSVWLDAAGVEIAAASRGPIYPDAALAGEAAALGQGVALGDSLLSQDDLRAGRLVAPFDLWVPYGGYFLVARDFARLSEPAAALSDWIRGLLAGGSEAKHG